MRLFPEVLATFATGCQGWQWHEDAWRGQRLPAMMQPLYEEPEGAKIRMQCGAGVRLRFVSDTTRLWIQLRYGVEARPIYKCDLVVDGKSTGGFGPDEKTQTWEGVIFQSHESKLRTFDIWLANMAQVDVLEIQLDDHCVIEPAPALPVKWLVYGDSITQGMVSSLPTTSAYGKACLELEAEMFNLAIGGAKLIEELATTVPDGHYDLISIAYGTNDFNQGILTSVYQANAVKLLEVLLAKFPQTPILLLTTLTWASRTEPNPSGQTLEDFRKALEPVAELSDRIILVDGSALVADDEALFVDRVHPNDAGFVTYGRELVRQARKALGA